MRSAPKKAVFNRTLSLSACNDYCVLMYHFPDLGWLSLPGVAKLDMGTMSQMSSTGETEKKIRNLKKKLRQIASLKEKVQSQGIPRHRCL